MAYTSQYNNVAPIEFNPIQAPLELATKVYGMKQQQFEQNFKQLATLKSSLMNLDLLNGADKANLEEKNKNINSYFSQNNLNFTDPNTIKSAVANFDGILNDSSLKEGVQRTKEWRESISAAQEGIKKGDAFSQINYDNLINGENGLSSYIQDESDTRNKKQVRAYTPAYDINANVYEKCAQSLKASKHVNTLPDGSGRLRTDMNETLEPSQIQDCIKSTLMTDSKAQSQLRELSEYNYRQNKSNPTYLQNEYTKYNATLDNQIKDYKSNIESIQNNINAHKAVHGDDEFVATQKTYINHFQTLAQKTELAKKKFDGSSLEFSNHADILTGNLIEDSSAQQAYARAINNTAEIYGEDGAYWTNENLKFNKEKWQQEYNLKVAEAQAKLAVDLAKNAAKAPATLEGVLGSSDGQYDAGSRIPITESLPTLVAANQEKITSLTTTLNNSIDNLPYISDKIDEIQTRNISPLEKEKAIADLRSSVMKTLQDHQANPSAVSLKPDILASGLIQRYEALTDLQDQQKLMQEYKNKAESSINNNPKYAPLKNQFGIIDPNSPNVYREVPNSAMIDRQDTKANKDFMKNQAGTHLVLSGLYQEYLKDIEDLYKKDPITTRILGFTPVNTSHAESNVEQAVLSKHAVSKLGDINPNIKALIAGDEDINVLAKNKRGKVEVAFSDNFYNNLRQSKTDPPNIKLETGRVIKYNKDTGKYPAFVIDLKPDNTDNSIDITLAMQEKLGRKSGYNKVIHSETVPNRNYNVRVQKENDAYVVSFGYNGNLVRLPATVQNTQDILPLVRKEILRIESTNGNK